MRGRAVDALLTRGEPVDEADHKLAVLKARIASGEYQVDPTLVADAIVRRIAERRALGAQSECSYPNSAPEGSASEKTTPGGPSATRPTHVHRAIALALSTAARAAAGTQAQSS